MKKSIITICCTVFFLVMFTVFAQEDIAEAELTQKYTGINEIGAEEYLENSEKIIQAMGNANLSIDKMKVLLQEVDEAFNQKKYAEVKAGYFNIKQHYESAFAARERFKIVDELIKTAEQKWRDPKQAKNMRALAQAAFEREDYVEAVDRAVQAQTIVVSEAKAVSWRYIFYYYWWAFLLATTILIIILIILYYRKKLILLSQRIEDLSKEELNIMNLIQENQQSYYEKKEISPSQYHKAMYEYEKRLNQIRRELAGLRTKRIKLVGIKKELENLEREKKHLLGLINKVQEQFYVEKTLSYNKYRFKIEEFYNRLAEVEESFALLSGKKENELDKNLHNYLINRRKPVKKSKLVEMLILPEKDMAKYKKFNKLRTVYETEGKKQLSKKITKIQSLKELKPSEKVKSEGSKENRLKKLSIIYKNG